MESPEQEMGKFEIASQPQISRAPFINEYGKETDIDMFGKPVERYVVKALVKKEDQKELEEMILGDADLHFLRTDSYDERGDVPAVYVHIVWIEKPWRGQRFGSMLMRAIEQRLVDEGAVGVLKDEIMVESDEPWQSSRKRFGMYERHDWQPVRRRSSKLVFNRSIIPKVDDEILYNFADGIADSYTRHERIISF